MHAAAITQPTQLLKSVDLRPSRFDIKIARKRLKLKSKQVKWSCNLWLILVMKIYLFVTALRQSYFQLAYYNGAFRICQLLPGIANLAK